MRPILAILAALVVAGLTALGVYLFRPPAAPSAPLLAPTVALVASATPVVLPTAAATAEATVVATAEATVVAAATAPAVAEAAVRVYDIDPSASTARFLLDEVLRGAPFTVVGATQEIAGQLLLDAQDLSSIQLGEMLINARTIATDNGFRDRAIRNAVLRTDQFELIRFTPTSIEGLPARGTVGETYRFTVRGDLTITDVTRPVDFTLEVSAPAEDTLQGRAEAVIVWRDFNLMIPDSPAVNSVADELTLQFDFTARRQP